MREILVRQKKRIEELLAAPDLLQQTLPGVEQAQREAERRYWPRRLEKLTEELDTEPARTRKTYDVRATRVEPVSLVNRWLSVRGSNCSCCRCPSSGCLRRDTRPRGLHTSGRSTWRSSASCPARRQRVARAAGCNCSCC